MSVLPLNISSQAQRSSIQVPRSVHHVVPPAPNESLHRANILPSSEARITEEERARVLAQDQSNWDFAWHDIFSPMTLLNKLLRRILYPGSGTSRSRLDKAFEGISSSGIPLEKHIIKTQDNHLIELWFARNSNPEARSKVYLHGNGSDILNFQKEAIQDFQNGSNICLFSYRGYPGNYGRPSQEGLIHDTSSVIDFLKLQNILTNTMDFEAHSLGCAVLLNTLALRPSAETYGDLLLMSPFKNIRAMAKTKYIPEFIAGLTQDSWDNFAAIPQLQNRISRLQIMHGKQDLLIPYQQSEELHKQAINHSINSELQLIEGIDHNGINRVMWKPTTDSKSQSN